MDTIWSLAFLCYVISCCYVSTILLLRVKLFVHVYYKIWSLWLLLFLIKYSISVFLFCSLAHSLSLSLFPPWLPFQFFFLSLWILTLTFATAYKQSLFLYDNGILWIVWLHFFFLWFVYFWFSIWTGYRMRVYVNVLLCLKQDK